MLLFGLKFVSLKLILRNSLLSLFKFVEMEFTGSNAVTYPPYDTTDVFKGICRTSKNTFLELGAKIGFIVHLNLTFDANNSCDVLCTLWPGDSDMEEGTMVIDDTVRVCGTVVSGWTDCKCKVLTASYQIGKTV